MVPYPASRQNSRLLARVRARTLLPQQNRNCWGMHPPSTVIPAPPHHSQKPHPLFSPGSPMLPTPTAHTSEPHSPTVYPRNPNPSHLFTRQLPAHPPKHLAPTHASADWKHRETADNGRVFVISSLPSLQAQIYMKAGRTWDSRHLYLWQTWWKLAKGLKSYWGGLYICRCFKWAEKRKEGKTYCFSFVSLGKQGKYYKMLSSVSCVLPSTYWKLMHFQNPIEVNSIDSKPAPSLSELTTGG